MQDQMVDTIVHGGVIVSSTDTYEAAIAIKDSKVVAIGPLDILPRARDYIDATGKYVLPGPIDCHIHLGSMAEGRVDDWTSGPIAAAHAGITTMVSFAQLKVAEKETPPDSVRRNTEVVSAESVIDFSFHIMMNNQPYVYEGLKRFIPEVMSLGVPSFKMFMTYKGQVTDEFMARAMDIIAVHGGLAQVHCENGGAPAFLEEKALIEGRIAPKDYPATRPPWIEDEAVNRALHLASMTNCPLHVVHVASKGALELIIQAQARGQRVSSETCPQYMLLNEDDMVRLGPFIKIAPPTRPNDMVHQNAMWDGLKNGYISVLASDHAPKKKEEQEPGWDNIFVGPDGKEIPRGAPNVQTLVLLGYSEGVVKRGLPISWLAKALSENPARIFGLYPRKGTIRPGSDADLLIIDPDPEYTIRVSDLHGNSWYSPYEGWTVKGRPWMTLLRGRVLLNQGQLQQNPGYGEFIPATSPITPV